VEAALSVVPPPELRGADQGIGPVDVRHPRRVGRVAVRVVPARERAVRGIQHDLLGEGIDLQKVVGVELRLQTPDP
jgi:hypothetical protein